jgi:glycosyltransferase involved in cell wall biosynthesis
MRIGLFIAFAGRNCGGPEVLERELTRQLLAIAPHHEYHLFCLNAGAAESLALPPSPVVWHHLRPAARPISMLTTLPRALRRVMPDVFHAPIVPPLISPVDYIMTMPCTTTLVHPEFYPPMIRLRLITLLHRGIGRALSVVCVSQHVQDLVRERFGTPVERLPIIYPGRAAAFKPQDPVAVRERLVERFGIRRPYLLFSGRWEARKNVVRTLEAFALFKRRVRTDYALVLTGKRTWAGNEAARAISGLGLDRDLIDLGPTAAVDLPTLYAGARSVVFASLWEGFGLPIIEGMASGTPVITSNVAAMPETAGGAALLVDPYSVEAISDAMQRISLDDTLHRRLRDRGLGRAAAFTWERTARETMALYEGLAGAPGASLARTQQFG